MISVMQLYNIIGDPGYQIIDIRDEKDYKKEHIQGAENIPFGSLKKRMSSINIGKNIIVYCERGSQSILAERMLRKEGYMANSLAGGFREYKRWK